MLTHIDDADSEINLALFILSYHVPDEEYCTVRPRMRYVPRPGHTVQFRCTCRTTRRSFRTILTMITSRVWARSSLPAGIASAGGSIYTGHGYFLHTHVSARGVRTRLVVLGPTTCTSLWLMMRVCVHHCLLCTGHLFCNAVRTY